MIDLDAVAQKIVMDIKRCSITGETPKVESTGVLELIAELRSACEQLKEAEKTLEFYACLDSAPRGITYQDNAMIRAQIDKGDKARAYFEKFKEKFNKLEEE